MTQDSGRMCFGHLPKTDKLINTNIGNKNKQTKILPSSSNSVFVFTFLSNSTVMYTFEKIPLKRLLSLPLLPLFMQHHIINFTLQAQEERTNREKQLEHEDGMAEELARISLERDRDKKMRQYIKENR